MTSFRISVKVIGIWQGFRVLGNVLYEIQSFQDPLESFQGFQGLLDTPG